MKKLKIGYISKYFHPIKGGEENYMLNLALQSAKAGLDVHVFTGDRKGKEKLKAKELTYKGIRIHRCRFIFEGTHYLFWNPTLLVKLLRTDLDIIHAASFGMIWHDFVLIIKKLFSKNTKFINTPHGPFMALKDYNIILSLFKSVYTSIQKLFVPWLYDYVLQDNTFQWQWISRYGIKKDKIKFVSVGIDKEIIERKIKLSSIKQFSRKYDLNGKQVLSYLGRLTKYKGVQDIIAVLPEIIQVNQNIILLVMGRDDGYLRTLKKLAEKKGVKKHIRFIENISEDDKYSALNISSIFIFPSEWEAFGIVLLEAMTQGNAVVTTKTEGGKFLITENVNGHLYEFGKNEQLLLILKGLIGDKTLIQKMIEKNLDKVKQFSWSNIAEDQYLPIIQSLVN